MRRLFMLRHNFYFITVVNVKKPERAFCFAVIDKAH